MFHHISKHFEFRQKYSAARRIFNSLLIIWKCDEALSLVFEIILKFINISRFMKEIKIYTCDSYIVFLFVNNENYNFIKELKLVFRAFIAWWKPRQSLWKFSSRWKLSTASRVFTERLIWTPRYLYLEQVTTYKYLGVQINENLTWEDHVALIREGEIKAGTFTTH